MQNGSLNEDKFKKEKHVTTKKRKYKIKLGCNFFEVGSFVV